MKHKVLIIEPTASELLQLAGGQNRTIDWPDINAWKTTRELCDIDKGIAYTHHVVLQRGIMFVQNKTWRILTMTPEEKCKKSIITSGSGLKDPDQIIREKLGEIDHISTSKMDDCCFTVTQTRGQSFGFLTSIRIVPESSNPFGPFAWRTRLSWETPQVLMQDWTISDMDKSIIVWFWRHMLKRKTTW